MRIAELPRELVDALRRPERIFARQWVSVIPGFSVFVHHIGTGGHPYETIGPPMCGVVGEGRLGGAEAGDGRRRQE